MHNVVDFIPERDRELYRRYREALRSKETRSHQEAIDMARHSPASRFYISIFQAYRGILRIKKGLKKEGGRIIRDKMIHDIYERYKKLEAKREFRGCSTYFITSFAVFQEVPEFYLSHSRALAIISKINREKRYEGKY